jgi:hypothetical protein
LTKLFVDAPGLSEPLALDLPDGASVLLGRNPEATPVSQGGASAVCVTLNSPSVSGSHAWVRREGDHVTVTDLGSRNGTWLRAPAHRALSAGVAPELRLQLASAPVAQRVESEPDDPRYSSRDDYGDAVAACVSRWLSRKGITARVLVAGTRAERVAEGPMSFHLASGASLRVLSDRTLDAGGERLVEGLRPWIARHNSAFIAEEETRGDGMILASTEIRAAHRVVVEAARRGIPSVVCLGPSGAGKERLARTFHRHTGRGGPFVPLNCALVHRDRAEADLFGAEPGAYTGLERARVGAVELAHGGTLFLDEVGELAPDVQASLLRFLDDGEFRRMGDVARTRHADVRIVCATNKDLREAALRGQFRADLWWRLGVQVIEVPPLSRRFDDVLAYLRARRLGAVSALDALHPEAVEVLRAHVWDGNFRELTNLVARLPLASRAGELDAATVRQCLAAGSLHRPEEPRAVTPSPAAVGWEEIARIKRGTQAKFSVSGERD